MARNSNDFLRWGDIKFYWFTFADGYRVCTRGLSSQELKREEIKHGKLIGKSEAE